MADERRNSGSCFCSWSCHSARDSCQCLTLAGFLDVDETCLLKPKNRIGACADEMLGLLCAG